MKLRTGDKVQVIAGKDKGKVSKIVKILAEKNTVLVEGVNMIKKHVKPGQVSKEGGIVAIEKPINISNVMFYDEKLQRPVKVGFKIDEKGKKYRISKKSGEAI